MHAPPSPHIDAQPLADISALIAKTWLTCLGSRPNMFRETGQTLGFGASTFCFATRVFTATWFFGLVYRHHAAGTNFESRSNLQKMQRHVESNRHEISKNQDIAVKVMIENVIADSRSLNAGNSLPQSTYKSTQPDTFSHSLHQQVCPEILQPLAYCLCFRLYCSQPRFRCLHLQSVLSPQASPDFAPRIAATGMTVNIPLVLHASQIMVIPRA